MASARDPKLKRFAGAKFIEETTDEDADNESGSRLAMLRLLADSQDSDSFFDVLQNSLAEAAALVEQRGWLAIGAAIGCFDDPPPLGDADRKIMLTAAESAEGVWPSWFRGFAASIGRDDISAYVPKVLRPASTASLATFQAAFILASEFKDPLLVALQRALHNPASAPYQPVESVSAEEVFEAIETSVDRNWSDPRPRQRFARLVGGFFQLTDLLAAFDALFPDDDTITIPPRPQTPRDAISKLTANLLMWRLNLWSEVVVQRLEVVGAAFWEMCGREFARYTEVTFRGSVPESRAEFGRLVDRWRRRGDLEPGSPMPDLSGIAGSGGGTHSVASGEFSFDEGVTNPVVERGHEDEESENARGSA